MFEYDAIRAAHRTASLIKNPKGKPMNVQLDLFIFTRGVTAAFRAQEILGAIRKGNLPGSSDRDGSGVPAFKSLEIPWRLNNTGYWNAIDTSMKNLTYGLQFKESQPIKLEGPNIVFKTGEIQYKGTTMFDLGHNDPRNGVASKNDNS